MARLYAVSPTGEVNSIQLETMNITCSFAWNGWTKFPNGLIFQWCELKTYDTHANNEYQYNYPIQFTHVYSVVFNHRYGTSETKNFYIRSIENKYFATARELTVSAFANGV